MPDKFARIPRLRDRVIPGPLQFLLSIPIINRVGISVRALEHLPIIKPLPSFRRSEIRAPASIHMPFADRPRFVTGAFKQLRNRHRIRVELDVIQKYAVCQRPLSRQKRSSRRRTHRQPRNRVREAHTFRSQSVEIRRLHVRISRKSESLRSPLIGQHNNNIRLPRLRREKKTKDEGTQHHETTPLLSQPIVPGLTMSTAKNEPKPCGDHEKLCARFPFHCPCRGEGVLRPRQPRQTARL